MEIKKEQLEKDYQSGLSISQIAKNYEVGTGVIFRANVNNILKGNSWKHIYKLRHKDII